MTSMVDCPECGAKLLANCLHAQGERVEAMWKYCPICEWNERRQLQEKMYDETKNYPGP